MAYAATNDVPLAPLSFSGVPTTTSKDQKKTEEDVIATFKRFMMEAPSVEDLDTWEGITLQRDLHVNWLERGLQHLPANFSGLDASRPWFVFWISHALEIMGAYEDGRWPHQVASFLGKCQDRDGGFGGGPGQLPHLAPTYAAMSAILIAGTDAAYGVVDRSKTYDFLMRMKSPGGGFRMHDQGETDMRGTYCAIAVASMCHILTDELIEGVSEYVSNCQTFEGGIAGENGLEAHGGYTYCGLAALCILGKAHALDLHLLLNWAAKRQMTLEGGFCGRSNKLVDSCYSFWQGAIFPLVHEAFRQQGEKAPPLPSGHAWFQPGALQTYVLLACQHQSGGLRDKPGKSADFYHTCYALSGIASSQYGIDGSSSMVGNSSNTLKRIDNYYNVLLERSSRKCEYFGNLPPFKLPDGSEVQGREGEGVVVARKHILEMEDKYMCVE